MDAIILAAGRGDRLRPLTDTLPKPLIQIAGFSLIELHLFRLAQAGYRRVIINLHHLGELIEAKLGNGERYGLSIHYSYEHGGALETAGGIIQALPLIQSQRFIAISADILCDFDLSSLHDCLKNNVNGHLVLIDNPEHHPEGDFGLNASGMIDNTQAAKKTFSGIACFDKQLFSHYAPQKRALRPVLERAITAQQLSGEFYSGLWSDIGTPERLKQAQVSPSVLEYIDAIKQSIS
ncbi:MAG: nucleotidyltransferase family protein [Arenicellales bacterium]